MHGKPIDLTVGAKVGAVLTAAAVMFGIDVGN
jgi:hypothetical protein